jgi:MFS family permease
MLVAFVAVIATLPATPPTGQHSSITAPFKALAHRGLLTVGITALLYNFGFFTLLAFTPFPLALGAHEVGLIFFGWGLLLAFTSVVVAPRLQRRYGTLPGMVGALLGFAVILGVMAIGTDSKAVLATGVILAGGFLGVNNTLITETVMKVAPVERGVASAAYSFVRFGGGAVAPWLAGKLGERSVHLPFWVGAGAVVLSVAVLLTAARLIQATDEVLGEAHTAIEEEELEAEAMTMGDA